MNKILGLRSGFFRFFSPPYNYKGNFDTILMKFLVKIDLETILQFLAVSGKFHKTIYDDLIDMKHLQTAYHYYLKEVIMAF